MGNRVHVPSMPMPTLCALPTALAASLRSAQGSAGGAAAAHHGAVRWPGRTAGAARAQHRVPGGGSEGGGRRFPVPNVSTHASYAHEHTAAHVPRCACAVVAVMHIVCEWPCDARCGTLYLAPAQEEDGLDGGAGGDDGFIDDGDGRGGGGFARRRFNEEEEVRNGVVAGRGRGEIEEPDTETSSTCERAVLVAIQYMWYLLEYTYWKSGLRWP